MIYHETQRSLWRFPRGAGRFFGTVASFAAVGNFIAHPTFTTGLIFSLAVILKMIPELILLKLGKAPDAAWSPDTHSARLQIGPLGPFLRTRFAFAIIALFVAEAQPWLALQLLLLAELFERQIYFQSVQAPKMPENFGLAHIAVRTAVTSGPPRRSKREDLPHAALALSRARSLPRAKHYPYIRDQGRPRSQRRMAQHRLHRGSHRWAR